MATARSSLADDVARHSEFNVEETIDIEMGVESTGASPGHDVLHFKVGCAASDVGRFLDKPEIPQDEAEEPNRRIRYRQLYTSFMSPETYRAVTSGDMPFFEKAIDQGRHQFSWEEQNPRGNSILHIASSLGHDEIVKLIVQNNGQSFFYIKNLTGDIPLHVAASAGHPSIVEMFLFTARNFTVTNSKDSVEQLLRETNNEENTPLHLALKNRYEKVARVLFDADPKVLYCLTLNKEGKSPLYLAAEAGFVELVKLMMEQLATSDISKMEGKSIVHAAITSKNIDVLETILMKSKTVIRNKLLMWKVDDEGLTPLSYAVSIGHLDGVRYILQGLPKCANINNTNGTFQGLPKCAYINNTDGTFPIHVASSKGHIKIIEEFIKCRPDSGEMLTKGNYWNILHVAAKNGKARAIRHMLKMPELEMLVNERDTNGNTPLHLASKGGHPKVVSILTWDKRVDLNLLNYEGNTARNIAANNNSENMPEFRKRLTWQALRYAGALRADELPSNIVRVKPQSLDQPEEILSKSPSLDQSGKPGSKPQSSETRELFSKPQSLDQSGEPPNKDNYQLLSKPQSSNKSGEPPNKDNYTDRVDTLLLVATLITTVTFAAGFTMPGGYSSSEPHQGMATFLGRPMFQSFLITNTIAMYTSITVVVALIWAHLGDLYLVGASLRVAVPLLGLALVMVSVTFMTGIYLAVSSLSWLAYTVLIMGSIFVFILVVLFVPLYSPISLNHYIPRYIFYYQLCLLIKVTRSDTDNKKGES